MLSPLTPEQVEVLSKPLTKSEKLQRWAEIVSKYPGPIRLAHSLEYWTRPDQLSAIHPGDTPMGLAAADPEFKEAGLKDSSVNSIKEFFGISQMDLHAFGCDCGGAISRDTMATRIRGLDRPLS